MCPLGRSQGVQGKNRRKMRGKTWGDSQPLPLQSPLSFQRDPHAWTRCFMCSFVFIGRIPPLITSSLLSCWTRTASGYWGGVPPGRHLHAWFWEVPAVESQALPQPPVPTLKKWSSLLDKGRASGHAPPDPARGGRWGARAQALPALVFLHQPTPFQLPRTTSAPCPCECTDVHSHLPLWKTVLGKEVVFPALSPDPGPTGREAAGKRDKDWRWEQPGLGSDRVCKENKTCIENFLHQIKQACVTLKVKIH